MSTQPTLHIRNVLIRVPGTTREAGHALAAALRARWGDLSATHSMHLGALHLRVPVPAGSPDLPGAVTSAVARHLNSPPTEPHA